MPTLTAPSEAVNKIAAALNLPKNTVAFTLRVRAGEAATLEVESYAEAGAAEELATVLKRYRLEELEGANVANEVAPKSPPVRALRLTLALEADTPDDMASALHNLAHRVERGEVTEGCWGGPSDGAIYELLVDPDMTHDVYHQKLREYLDSRPKRAA